MKTNRRAAAVRAVRGSADPVSALLAGAIALCLTVFAIASAGALSALHRAEPEPAGTTVPAASDDAGSMEPITAPSASVKARPWESVRGSAVSQTQSAGEDRESDPSSQDTSRPYSIAVSPENPQKEEPRHAVPPYLIGTARESPVQTDVPDFAGATPLGERIEALAGSPPKAALSTGTAAASLPSAGASAGAWHTVENCRITHYCSCRLCCGKDDGITATGTHVLEGRTVAVDPKVIPLGSEVLLGNRIYIAEDTGVTGNAVDVFINSHTRSLRLGMYHATVQWRSAG